MDSLASSINIKMAEQIKTTQVKLVFHQRLGLGTEVRRAEVLGIPSIGDIKSKVALIKPQLDEYKLGWKDEEGNFVRIENDEELGIAITQQQRQAQESQILVIHIIRKMGEEDFGRSGIRMPQEYKKQLRGLERILEGEDVEVVTMMETKTELVAIMKEQPGILFARGIEVKGGSGEVLRVVGARRLLEMAGEEVALLFVPMSSTSDKLEAHLMGQWQAKDGLTFVAFNWRMMMGGATAGWDDGTAGRGKRARGKGPLGFRMREGRLGGHRQWMLRGWAPEGSTKRGLVTRGRRGGWRNGGALGDWRRERGMRGTFSMPGEEGRQRGGARRGWHRMRKGKRGHCFGLKNDQQSGWKWPGGMMEGCLVEEGRTEMKRAMRGKRSCKHVRGEAKVLAGRILEKVAANI